MHLYDPESLIDAKVMVSDGLSRDIPFVPANPASNFEVKPFDFFSQYTSVTCDEALIEQLSMKL